MKALRGSARNPVRTKRVQEAILDEPTTFPLEAAGAMEEIIAHLPGEDRESLLVLAEEHGVPRSEGEAALVLLEQHGRAKRTTDSGGVERWGHLGSLLGAPPHVHASRSGAGLLPLYSRNDLGEQRWRLVPGWAWCLVCGPVRVR